MTAFDDVFRQDNNLMLPCYWLLLECMVEACIESHLDYMKVLLRDSHVGEGVSITYLNKDVQALLYASCIHTMCIYRLCTQLSQFSHGLLQVTPV